MAAILGFGALTILMVAHDESRVAGVMDGLENEVTSGMDGVDGALDDLDQEMHEDHDRLHARPDRINDTG